MESNKFFFFCGSFGDSFDLKEVYIIGDDSIDIQSYLVRIDGFTPKHLRVGSANK